jgi:cell division protein FtsI/penicillin-binding protein 2
MSRRISTANFERRGAFALACITALLAIAVAMWFISAVRAEPSTSRSYYDQRGSFAGSSVTRGNQTTFTDRNGRFDGTAIKNSDGTTSFYDKSGRFTGSSTNTTQPR